MTTQMKAMCTSVSIPGIRPVIAGHSTRARSAGSRTGHGPPSAVLVSRTPIALASSCAQPKRLPDHSRFLDRSPGHDSAPVDVKVQDRRFRRVQKRVRHHLNIVQRAASSGGRLVLTGSVRQPVPCSAEEPRGGITSDQGNTCRHHFRSGDCHVGRVAAGRSCLPVSDRRHRSKPARIRR